MYNDTVLNINICRKLHIWFHNKAKNKQNPTITHYVTKDHIAMHAVLLKNLKHLYSLVP